MNVLEVEGLIKRYGNVRAVEDVSLHVARGEIYGLVGPNGSGKTTTLSCALGLLRPDAGRVRVLGLPAREIHRSGGRVAVVFDSATLVDGLTCRQNLAYTRRLLGHDGGREDDEALRLTGLERLADRRAGRLSLGQRRRLAIARALIGSPELLVLDEPLSGLDTVGVTGMLELFRRLNRQGQTLLLSSHRLHEMESVVTRVAILVDGRLAREAPLAELLEGGRLRLLLRATPVERAREVLGGLEGLERIELRRTDELLVMPGGHGPAEINRALVDAGCSVHALVPERVTLQSAFEELVEPGSVEP
jgi:ABC-type multidrug transport system ATPase subunit